MLAVHFIAEHEGWDPGIQVASMQNGSRQSYNRISVWLSSRASLEGARQANKWKQNIGHTVCYPAPLRSTTFLRRAPKLLDRICVGCRVETQASIGFRVCSRSDQLLNHKLTTVAYGVAGRKRSQAI